MSAELEDVLRRVAAGEITPEEALTRLDGPQARPSESHEQQNEPTDEPPYGTPPTAQAEPSGPVTDLKAVRITTAYRSLEVIADPSVSEAIVSGPHTVRRDGGVLVVDTPDLPTLFNDDTEGGRFSFAALPRGLAWARSWRDHQLSVRVNPRMPVEIDGCGLSLRLAGAEAGARIRLVASAAKVERVRGPIDVDAVSSSVKGTIEPTGESRIAAESSSVKVSLLEGSGVRITANNRMGKVVLPSGPVTSTSTIAETRDTVVGDGRGHLTVESLMSSVLIGTGA